MRPILAACLAFTAFGALSPAAKAQEITRPTRQELLREFDANRDGELDEGERRTARETITRRRSEGAERGVREGRGDAARRGRGEPPSGAGRAQGRDALRDLREKARSLTPEQRERLLRVLQERRARAEAQDRRAPQRGREGLRGQERQRGRGDLRGQRGFQRPPVQRGERWERGLRQERERRLRERPPVQRGRGFLRRPQEDRQRHEPSRGRRGRLQPTRSI